ncbi:MAG TPA: flagellar export chaperone FliS [Steroidobacteraceae bacterium]|jgi:flagellar protein FliS
MSLARKSKVAAYQSVSVHGGVANSDPHGLVLMLMDAAVERMNSARGCMERGEIARKAKLLHSCISIIAELRGCLDMTRGGAIAQNLSDLYDYMMRQLLRANVDNKPQFVTEVLSLLGEIRGAWITIGPEVRHMTRATLPSA